MGETGTKRKEPHNDVLDDGVETKKAAVVVLTQAAKNDDGKETKKDDDGDNGNEDKDDTPENGKDKQHEQPQTSSSSSSSVSSQIFASTPHHEEEDLSTLFPSLPLGDKSSSPTQQPLLGLLFAASWCSDCIAVIKDVANFASANKTDVHILYVASDNTEAQVDDFCPPALSIVPPFQSHDERANLKRYFGACASKERDELGMTADQHKHGIPTLVVLDAQRGTIVTRDGIKDILATQQSKSETDDDNERSSPSSAVKKWKALLKKLVK